jgi:hypothetical protein
MVLLSNCRTFNNDTKYTILSLTHQSLKLPLLFIKPNIKQTLKYTKQSKTLEEINLRGFCLKFKVMISESLTSQI